MKRARKPTKLTLRQAYVLLCATRARPGDGPPGRVNLWDGAPSAITVEIDGARREIRDPYSGKADGNALATRGLMMKRGSCYEVTDAGRAAIAERADLVRQLAGDTDERKRKDQERAEAQDREYAARSCGCDSITHDFGCPERGK